MSKKIFGELEDKVMGLAKSGYNANRIAVEVGVSEGTVSSWAKKNGIFLHKRISPETLAKEPVLVKRLASGEILKDICHDLGLDHRAAVRMAEKNGLSHLLRNRSDSARDKLLDLEEVNSRLPRGHGVVTHYDSLLRAYVIKRDDGTTYTRITSQVFRGDPLLSQKRRCTEEEVAQDLSKIGYRLIQGTYIKKHAPLKAEHLICGYIRENVLYNIKKQQCPRCSNTGTSLEEKGLDDYIRSLGFETTKYRFPKDCAGSGKGKEIDIFIEDLKIGIEYCGLFSHGESERLRCLGSKIKKKALKGREYVKTDYDDPTLFHKIKLNKAENLGFRLITVFSNEWKKDNEKVKAILKAQLGKNATIVAATVELREISTKDLRAFIKSYSILEYEKASKAFGLFYKNELVATISGLFSNNKNVVIMANLCYKFDFTVVGGTKILVEALEEWAKSNGISEIRAWTDNRWSNGSEYKESGYVFTCEFSPSFKYFDNRGKIYARNEVNEEKLISMGAAGDTEWEMAKSVKMDRIWDCGKKVWSKKLVNFKEGLL